MDKTVNVRFYSVENIDGDSVKFSDCLADVFKKSLPARELEVEPDIIVRLEKLSPLDGHFFSGQLVRLQSHNLPPKAISGKPIEKLGIASIGHTSTFIYDTKRSVIAMQIPRNGLNPQRMNLYHQQMLSVEGHEIWPLLTNDAWSKLASNRIRKVLIRVATPENLTAVEPDHVSIKNSLSAMKKVAETTYIEATFGMGRAQEDITKGKARNLLRWMVGQRQDKTGGVRKVAAEIINDNDDHEILQMTDGHMGDKTKLDLPDDNPTKSHKEVEKYIRTLFKQFGSEIDKQINN
tara:strand:+ start:7665 stop:8540 length:876 start_codon:yes stop_codon:yes gene_type:complete